VTRVLNFTVSVAEVYDEAEEITQHVATVELTTVGGVSVPVYVGPASYDPDYAIEQAEQAFAATLSALLDGSGIRRAIANYQPLEAL
jgi:hypothetical protein